MSGMLDVGRQVLNVVSKIAGHVHCYSSRAARHHLQSFCYHVVVNCATDSIKCDASDAPHIKFKSQSGEPELFMRHPYESPYKRKNQAG